MEDYITKPVYDETMKRIESEEHRQNTRIDRLEGQMETLTELTVSVREIAVSVKNMQEELKKQGDRLEAIEREPADNWKKVVWLVVAALVGFGIHALLGI